MKTKQEIVENWLPRYTKRPLKDFPNIYYWQISKNTWKYLPII